MRVVAHAYVGINRFKVRAGDTEEKNNVNAKRNGFMSLLKPISKK